MDNGAEKRQTSNTERNSSGKRVRKTTITLKKIRQRQINKEKNSIKLVGWPRDVIVQINIIFIVKNTKHTENCAYIEL